MYYNTTEERLAAVHAALGLEPLCDYDMHIASEQASEINRNDRSEADDHPLTLSPKGRDLALSALNTVRHQWTRNDRPGCDSEWLATMENCSSPPERAINYELNQWASESTQARLFAVSPQFPTGFALHTLSQWTKIAGKAVQMGRCDAYSVNLLAENSLDGHPAPSGTGSVHTGCEGEDAALATVYAVKFGEYISVIAVCEHCAAILATPYDPTWGPAPFRPLSLNGSNQDNGSGSQSVGAEGEDTWAQIIHVNFAANKPYDPEH